jgi:hypothetical protein
VGGVPHLLLLLLLLCPMSCGLLGGVPHPPTHPLLLLLLMR